MMRCLFFAVVFSLFNPAFTEAQTAPLPQFHNYVQAPCFPCQQVIHDIPTTLVAANCSSGKYCCGWIGFGGSKFGCKTDAQCKALKGSKLPDRYCGNTFATREDDPTPVYQTTSLPVSERYAPQPLDIALHNPPCSPSQEGQYRCLHGIVHRCIQTSSSSGVWQWWDQGVPCNTTKITDTTTIVQPVLMSTKAGNPVLYPNPTNASSLAATCTPWYPSNPPFCRRECCRWNGWRTVCSTDYKICGAVTANATTGTNLVSYAATCTYGCGNGNSISPTGYGDTPAAARTNSEGKASIYCAPRGGITSYGTCTIIP